MKSLEIILLPLFAFLLVVSIAGASIGAGVVIVLAIFLGRRDSDVRLLWIISICFVAALALLDAAQNGMTGFQQALRETWTILVLPAAAALATERNRELSTRVLLYGFCGAAVVFLYFYATTDPAIEGHYGFHSAPYAFAIMLAAPSWLAMCRYRIRFAEIALWMLLAVALFLVNTRGVIIAWLVGSALFLAFFPREKRIPRRVVALLLLLVLFFGAWKAQRWQLLDFEKQHSIQQRFAIWAQVIEEFGEQPIFGYGFNRFRADPSRVGEKYRSYLDNQTNPHSGYLMMLHAGGMFGFLLLWAVYASLFYLLLRRARIHRDTFALVAASNMLAIMIGAFGDKTFFMTLPVLQNWFLAGLALGGSRGASRP